MKKKVEWGNGQKISSRELLQAHSPTHHNNGGFSEGFLLS